MRTTITLDDALLEDLKRKAAEHGLTVSRLIEQSVRQTMARESVLPNESEGFELLTYGKGGDFSPFNVEKASTLIELEDLERFGRSRR